MRNHFGGVSPLLSCWLGTTSNSPLLVVSDKTATVFIDVLLKKEIQIKFLKNFPKQINWLAISFWRLSSTAFIFGKPAEINGSLTGIF